MVGFLGTKIGCSSFIEGDKRVCVTLIKIHSGYVIEKKNIIDGEVVLCVGFCLKNHRIYSAQLIDSKNKSSYRCNVFREFSCSNDLGVCFNIGDKYGLNTLEKCFHEHSLNLFKVSGLSIGKGFAGVVKRYKFKGGNRSHGNSLTERALGSTGQQNSERVFKNKKMAGRMGGMNCSVHNIRLLDINYDEEYIVLKGSVPGCKNNLVLLHC